MRKSELTDGSPMYVISIKHFVTKQIFANALTQHCWRLKIDFDRKMKKKNALKILKNELKFSGMRGAVDMSLYEGGSYEAVAGFENNYPLAEEWVENNYPYLKQS